MPFRNYVATDHCVYTALYENSLSHAAVTVTVHPLNARPLAVDDEVSVPRDQEVQVPILANDLDPEEAPLAVAGTTAAKRGRVTAVENQVHYVPDAGYEGRDWYTCTVMDQHGAADWAVVTVEVEMSRGDDSVTVTASDSDITSASVSAMVDAMDRLVADESEQVIADD
jgi:hypothetical protein